VGSLKDYIQKQGKLKLKVNYSENPNQKDFFAESFKSSHIELGSLNNLNANWEGNFNLIKEDVFWINPIFSSSQIHPLIYFGPYNISFIFSSHNDKDLIQLFINQEGVIYGQAYLDIASDRQINYWTKATSDNWIQIVRGKIFRINNEELYTLFQTTVYEEKIPIYAFRGESVLRKKKAPEDTVRYNK